MIKKILALLIVLALVLSLSAIVSAGFVEDLLEEDAINVRTSTTAHVHWTFIDASGYCTEHTFYWSIIRKVCSTGYHEDEIIVNRCPQCWGP